MMKRNNKKRGFTIIELTIVVAVIAILSAVLIPTFAGIIREARRSSDEQTVRNMNTVLATIADEDISYNDMAEALDEAGYNVLNKNSAWNPSYKDYSAYWVAEENTIVLVENDQIVFPENLKGAFDETKAMALKSSNYIATSEATTSAAAVADIKTAINNGTSVTLTNAVELTDVKSINVPEDVELTVDLGGSTLTTDERNPGVDHQYAFNVYGELTIKNAVIEARGVEVREDAVLILEEGVEVTAVDGNGGAAVYVYEGGEVVINGGTYTNSTATDVEMAGATTVISYGKLTINGGTFTSTAGVYAVCVYGGEASINNATITGARGGIAVADDDAVVTITNCTVTSNWTASNSCYALYVSAGNVTVSNSTFTSANGVHTYGTFTQK